MKSATSEPLLMTICVLLDLYNPLSMTGQCVCGWDAGPIGTRPLRQSSWPAATLFKHGDVRIERDVEKQQQLCGEREK